MLKTAKLSLGVSQPGELDHLQSNCNVYCNILLSKYFMKLYSKLPEICRKITNFSFTPYQDREDTQQLYRTAGAMKSFFKFSQQNYVNKFLESFAQYLLFLLHIFTTQPPPETPSFPQMPVNVKTISYVNSINFSCVQKLFYSLKMKWRKLSFDVMSYNRLVLVSRRNTMPSAKNVIFIERLECFRFYNKNYFYIPIFLYDSRKPFHVNT